MSNLILNIACSVQMSQVARTTLLKALSRNASMALAKPAEDLTLVLNCDSGMMVQGKFGPAALVTCISSSLVKPSDQIELSAGIAAAFREGLPLEPQRIKFAFVRNLAGSEAGWEDSTSS